MQVKAQALLNAAKWIEEEFGRATLEQILQTCSPGLRARCASAIAINWHPMLEFVEFLEAVERVVGTGDGRIAERIGEAGARANMKGALIGMAFWVANPELLAKRVAGLWRQFNDEGSLSVLHVGHDFTRFELKGISNPNQLFCCTVTGWGLVTAEVSGMANPTARHIECRARGALRCQWEVGVPLGRSLATHEGQRTRPNHVRSP